MILSTNALKICSVANSIKYYFYTISYKRGLSTMQHNYMIKCVRDCIPPLGMNNHKGQAGRIGIVGGSLEYTGAPYFAGISALKVGADLVHVFCASSAATVIKSYSPELIVHPLLDSKEAVQEISPWLERLHAIVIGPGLGRDNGTLTVVEKLIDTIQQKKIPLIIDADGLFLITEKPEIVQNFSSPLILTPNKIEFERLCNKINGVSNLSELGKNVVVLKKGQTDEVFFSICPENVVWQSNAGGSNRRCGGQGDILSGSIATFFYWILSNIDKTENTTVDKSLLAASLSCYAGSVLVRKCNEVAFNAKGRSMLASDMIEHIHKSFEDLFGQ